MISADEALRIILDAVPRSSRERVSLEDASGRTSAEDVVSREDIPPFTNSSMDGYAVSSRELRHASADRPVVLTIAGESSAGNPFAGRFGKGCALRIMTGGKLPAGADSVVPLEIVVADGARSVTFTRAAAKGDYVRRPGEDIARGTRVVARGDLLTPAHLGVLASAGRAALSVSVRPRVGILATGDELVSPEKKPGDGRIRNSTSYTLLGAVRESGGKPRFLGIVPDRKKLIRKRILKALDSDILLLTGGVSVGAHDHVREVLKTCGVDILFWRVNIRPGGPLLFGVSGKTLVFGLPGNPVSTGVTFYQFVRPAIRKFLGRNQIGPPRFSALTDEPLVVKDGKRCYLRAVVRQEGGLLHVKTTGSQSSGVMSSLLKANCLIIVAEGTGPLPAGSSVSIEFLRDPF